MSLLHADVTGQSLPRRATAAPKLANALHDGPDEPLLLHHDSHGGMYRPLGMIAFGMSPSANPDSSKLQLAQLYILLDAVGRYAAAARICAACTALN